MCSARFPAVVLAFVHALVALVLALSPVTAPALAMDAPATAPHTFTGESVTGELLGSSAGTQLDGRVAVPSMESRSGLGDRSWSYPLNQPFGSPVMAQLDGGGPLEIVVGDASRFYAFDHTGQLLAGWPVNTGSSVDHGAAVGDMDNDGVPEIAFTTRSPRLRVLRTDGTPLPGFPVSLPMQGWLNASGAVLVDLDQDGYLDVGAQSELGVSFYDRTGQPLPGWPYTWWTTQNIVWSAPAVGDLDNDGHLEVVVGNNCLYQESVHVIRDDGTAMPGWPQSTGIIFASCALGDLDGDGDLEIVAQEGDPGWYGNRMHVWHHDGTPMAGWPREIVEQWQSSRSNPAIADVDGDGNPEIVTATADSRIHAFRPDGTEILGFPILTPAYDPISSVQVLDVDGDGAEEVFLCYYQGSGQWVAGWKAGGTMLPGFPMQLIASSQLNAHGSAHIADIDGDGDLEIAACGLDFGAGSVRVLDMPGSVYNPARADWPKIRRDLYNTGRFEMQDPTSAELPTPSVRPGSWRVYPNPVAVDGILRIGPGDGMAADGALSVPAPAASAGAMSKANGTSETSGMTETIGTSGTMSVALLDASGRRMGQAMATAGGTISLASMMNGRSLVPGVYWVRWELSEPSTRALDSAAGDRGGAARVVIVRR